jgi:hypothetical protein
VTYFTPAHEQRGGLQISQGLAAHSPAPNAAPQVMVSPIPNSPGRSFAPARAFPASAAVSQQNTRYVIDNHPVSIEPSFNF